MDYHGVYIRYVKPGLYYSRRHEHIYLSGDKPAHHILKLAFGVDAVTSAQLTYDGKTFAGDGLVLKNKKIQGTWAILNDAEDQLLILNNTALYASMVMDTDARGVVAIDFNGTIESDGTNPDVLFLRKQGGSSSE